MAAKFAVTGDQGWLIDGRMCEIKRQLRQKGGSPLDPEAVARELQRLVEGTEFIVGAARPVFPIWKTIKLGTGLRTADDFRAALRDGGHKVSNRAGGLLGQPAFTAATEETEVDLVKVTFWELGFQYDARRDQIYACTQGLGLRLCPAEGGPQLRLQYPDQPLDEWLLIGMEPIVDSGGRPLVFVVRRDDSDSWLHARYGRPSYFWGPGCAWVFVLPRPSTTPMSIGGCGASK